MNCPHCLIAFHSQQESMDLTADKDSNWRIDTEICPGCKKIIVYLKGVYWGSGMFIITREFLVYPKGISRKPISPHVPEKYVQDYNEACLVLSDSAKASAALSRRCLQNILREAGQFSR